MWGAGSDNTIERFRSNSKDETFSITDAGTTREVAEIAFQERLDLLLEDFDSILRTIPLERELANEELTAEDLQDFAQLINAEANTLGQIIVSYDPNNEYLILHTAYDVDFQVTSGVGSFAAGTYTGNYSAIEKGFLIKFKTPTSDQRDSYRLTSDHRLPYVTTSGRDIQIPIEGDFTLEISSIPPVDDTTNP